MNFRGLEPDQKVLAAHRCYAMTATTALTVQNTRGVQDIHVVPTDFVERQMRACIDDIGVDVYKIGGFGGGSVRREGDELTVKKGCLQLQKP